MSFPEMAIQLGQLRLDLQNPRFADTQGDHEQAVLTMIREQGDKIVALAEHIVEHGMNPASLPIVTPSDDGSAYIVLDGNRRLVALLALADPRQVNSVLSAPGVQKLHKLARKFAEYPVRQLTCCVADGREEANVWIVLQHRGQQQGAGLVEWDGQVAARFDQRNSLKSRELQVLDLVLDHGALSSESRETITRGKFPITTLGRLLGTPYVREKLGIAGKSAESGEILVGHSPDEVLVALTKVVDDIGTGQITVSHLKSQKQRIDYVNNLSAVTLPPMSSKLIEPVPLSIVDRHDDLEIDGSRTRVGSVVPIRRDPPPRNTLVPRDTTIKVPRGRIRDIFKELRKLPLDEYPNAAGVMLRVFVEMSVDHFIDDHTDWPLQQKEKSTLSFRLTTVADNLEKSNRLTKEQVAPLKKAASGQTILVASATNMNKIVHSPYSYPKPGELLAAWDELEPILAAIWE